MRSAPTIFGRWGVRICCWGGTTIFGDGVPPHIGKPCWDSVELVAGVWCSSGFAGEMAGWLGILHLLEFLERFEKFWEICNGLLKWSVVTGPVLNRINLYLGVWVEWVAVKSLLKRYPTTLVTETRQWEWSSKAWCSDLLFCFMHLGGCGDEYDSSSLYED